jgi:hypothetical protein
MKRIFIISLLVAVLTTVVNAQTPKPNYTFDRGRRSEQPALIIDSALHIPYGCGAPTSYTILGTKSWKGGVAVYGDSCAKVFYVMFDSVWYRFAKFSEIGDAFSNESMVSDWRKQNYQLSQALNLIYRNENRQTVTVSSHLSFMHGFIYQKDKLWASDMQFPNNLIRFNNPNDLTDYDTLQIGADGNEGDGYDLIYVPSKDKIYAITNNTGLTGHAKIYEVDPVTLTKTLRVDYDATFFEISSLATDNIYLYALVTGGTILKINLSDFSFTTHSISSSSNAHSIRYDGTYLYVTDVGNQRAWQVRPSDMSVLNTTDFGASGFTDDFCFAGDNLYCGVETTSGSIYVINKITWTSSTIATGVAAECFGTFFDGKYVWAVFNTSPGTIVRIDPETKNVYKFTLSSGENTPSEIISDGQRFFITSYINPSKVIRMSVPSLTYVRDAGGITSLTTTGSSGASTYNTSTGALNIPVYSGGGTPAGNFGNVQINRSGVLSTPGSDSLDFESATGLTVKGAVNITGQLAQINGQSLTWPGANSSGLLDNNGSGGLTWRPQADITWGGLVAGTNTQSGSITVSNAHQALAFNGSSPATWTLPTISGNLNRFFFFKNIGSATLTIQRGGSDQIYTTSLVNSFTIAAGEYATIWNNGTNWFAHYSPGSIVAALTSVGGGEDIQTGNAGNVRTFNTNDVSVSSNLLSIKKQMSIIGDASGLKLDGDEASPTDNKFYGKVGGVKGYFLPVATWSGQVQSVISASGSLTLNSSYVGYAFTGSSPTTWTVGDRSTYANRVFYVKNRGSATLTLQRSGSDQLYTTSAVNTYDLSAGEYAIIWNDGVYWIVHQMPTGGGGGNVTKVGTPANNEVGVWTGDGTLGRDANFIYDLSADELRVNTSDLGDAKIQTAITASNQAAIYIDMSAASGKGIVVEDGDQDYILNTNHGFGIQSTNSATEYTMETVNRAFKIQARGSQPMTITTDGSLDINVVPGGEAVITRPQFETTALFKDLGSDPSTPTSGYISLYGKNDAAYIKNDNAVVARIDNTVSHLTTNTTDAGNVGAGEDDLITYSVPAGTLATDGDYIEFTMTFTFAANANSKQIKVYFGSTAIYTSGARLQNDGTLTVTGRVIRTGAATQDAAIEVSTNTVNFDDVAFYSTAAETLSGAITLKATGEGVSNNDIVQKILTVKYIRSN